MLIELTDSKSEEIFNDILFDYCFAKSPQIETAPSGVILGGQPEAGKSFLVREVENEFQKDFIFISADDLRLYHSAYLKLQQNPETVQNAANLVNGYASAWTERLIKHCIENKFNLIIDSENLEEFKVKITEESNHVPAKLKKKILKTITNIN